MHDKKILLVDDSNTVLMMERMMLRDAGYDFVVALDGVEAIDKAVTEHPDLILLDIMMPRTPLHHEPTTIVSRAGISQRR